MLNRREFIKKSVVFSFLGVIANKVFGSVSKGNKIPGKTDYDISFVTKSYMPTYSEAKAGYLADIEDLAIMERNAPLLAIPSKRKQRLDASRLEAWFPLSEQRP